MMRDMRLAERETFSLMHNRSGMPLRFRYIEFDVPMSARKMEAEARARGAQGRHAFGEAREKLGRRREKLRRDWSREPQFRTRFFALFQHRNRAEREAGRAEPRVGPAFDRVSTRERRASHRGDHQSPRLRSRRYYTRKTRRAVARVLRRRFSGAAAVRAPVRAERGHSRTRARRGGRSACTRRTRTRRRFWTPPGSCGTPSRGATSPSWRGTCALCQTTPALRRFETIVFPGRRRRLRDARARLVARPGRAR